MVICDTHALLFWASQPEKLSKTAAEVLEGALTTGVLTTGGLACADITLWEIAMLASKRRIVIPVPPADNFRDILLALRLQVLPISAEIATLLQSAIFRHGDPANRLIGATALHCHAPLISADQQLAAITGMRVIW